LVEPNTTLNNYNNKSDDESYYEDCKDTLSVIKQYNDKLEKLRKICLKYFLISIDTCDNKIYCLSKDKTNYYYDNKFLYIYDDKMVNLMKVECNPNQPFYILNNVNKVQICENYYVFRDGKNEAI
jgi:hypothetical protein